VARRVGRWLVVPLLAATLVGCGGAATPSAPASSPGPSASAAALGEAELAVCDGTVRMAEGVTSLRSIRLRRGAETRLTSALDLVTEGQRLILDYAPGRMATRVRTLGFAVTNMTIAVEDFRTTDQLDAAAANVKRRTTALRRAIDAFRVWVGCPSTASDPTGASPSAPGSADPSSPLDG